MKEKNENIPAEFGDIFSRLFLLCFFTTTSLEQLLVKFCCEIPSSCWKTAKKS